MRKGQTSHKKEHNTRMCFPLKPVFTRDKGGLPNFIDEPTTGLDPQTRLLIWDIIEKLRVEEKLTVFLTAYSREVSRNSCEDSVYDTKKDSDNHSGKLPRIGT